MGPTPSASDAGSVYTDVPTMLPTTSATVETRVRPRTNLGPRASGAGAGGWLGAPDGRASTDVGIVSRIRGIPLLVLLPTMVSESRPVRSRSKVPMVLGALALLAIGVVVAFVARGPVERPDGGVGLLPVGALAPDLAGHDPQGKDARLSAQLGHTAVVYFYPRDETPGCTHEACAFRDAFDRYRDRGITIFGVSRDSEASHGEFRAKHSLPFPLVADESGSIQRSYGVSGMLGMASRVTFLVGPDGKVARVWPDVDPGVHATEVLAAAEALGATASAH